jgi:uncharacterized protein (TIGR00255 family)
MLKSMTAFARNADQGDWGSLVWELRSVNHRYLEISLRLPEVLRDLEMVLREKIRSTCKRGKIECFLKLQTQTQAPQWVINQALVQQISSAHRQIKQVVEQVAPLEVMHVLNWPGVLQVEEVDQDFLKNKMLHLFEQALHQLEQTRQQEGSHIAAFLLQRLSLIEEQLVLVNKHLPVVLVNQRQKLLDRLAEVVDTLDESRLEQEMVIFAQKIDVSEEIDRLQGHVKEIKRIIAKEEVAGRRLDFLMQELNREANTLGSKSVNTDITMAAVELKVLIEQMREQIQNVE